MHVAFKRIAIKPQSVQSQHITLRPPESLCLVCAGVTALWFVAEHRDPRTRKSPTVHPSVDANPLTQHGGEWRRWNHVWFLPPLITPAWYTVSTCCFIIADGCEQKGLFGSVIIKLLYIQVLHKLFFVIINMLNAWFTSSGIASNIYYKTRPGKCFLCTVDYE